MIISIAPYPKALRRFTIKVKKLKMATFNKGLYTVIFPTVICNQASNSEIICNCKALSRFA